MVIMRFPRFFLCLFILGFLSPPVFAGEGFGAVQHMLFVAGRDAQSVAVIDTNLDQVVGHLDLGLVPRQMVVSESLATLVAADERTAGVAVVNLVGRSTRMVPLSFAPTRLLLSPDGVTLAAFDDAEGRVALVDLLTIRETGRLAGPRRIRDAIFSGNGAALFVAADSVEGVAVLGLGAGRPTALIQGPTTFALARSPNGRDGFALARGAVLHFDLGAGSELKSAPAPEVGGLFLSGTGQTLMLPAPDAATVTLVSAGSFGQSAPLKAARGVAAVYSAWFDTVAFAPDDSGALQVYDLEHRARTGSIALGGVAGAGTVTPDGGKLYLPLERAGELVVVDTAQRRRLASVTVDIPPVRAVMAGGYGICH